ncbi:hypothetical protein CKM354_000632700 [Cercospora kikuchii]|uniref:CCHC-type domain-containing protein n=1 Tax=Cercospora kikuchii TaxID=84275 RepID=A0A9P3CJ63_9PEZI|nr:uncharacterized protein CKM354_000632700 [Cercospora kikuchii]GIZ43086.1 hypothetical protein CKM354_000632700 [Cercospora kikuchii]
MIQEQVAVSIQQQVAASIQEQLANVGVPTKGSRSYAEVACTPPDSQPSNIRSLTMSTTPSAFTNSLYCTIDISRADEAEKAKTHPGVVRECVEREMRGIEGQERWRCVAVTKDPRNADRIRVACRNEGELTRVKEAMLKTAAATPGSRVLRDQLYPIKVDNANRTAVITETGDLRPGVIEMLEKENETKIAKIVWISRKDSMKAYGSMIVYLMKGNDAARLLQEQYFHVAGESAYTRVCEPRRRPMQCYRCQEIGHIAHTCNKPQRCAKCAQEGHRHTECDAEGLVPKCIPCGGPHESYSRNCQILHPPPVAHA